MRVLDAEQGSSVAAGIEQALVLRALGGEVGAGRRGRQPAASVIDSAGASGRIVRQYCAMATNWRTWHAKYDEPGSSLARRLTIVRRRVAETLAGQRDRSPMRILSLCSGDGPDLLPELANCAEETPDAVLVEQDERLASDARANAGSLRLDQVRVVAGDAGDSATFAFALPVDLLMLCGIFGNVSECDIASTVAATPTMLRPGATVIWTRGSSEPDLRPAIRHWFLDAGFREIAFDSEPHGFGVGMAQLSEPGADRPLPRRLFTFLR
jgi:hypothetical protein